MPQNRLTNIHIVTVTAYLLATILLCFETAHAKPGKGLYFTVQAGSYVHLEFAEKSFLILEDNMPEHMRTDLRIEYIAPYHALRIGKLYDRQDALLLLDHVKKYFPEAYILEAYIKEERVKKNYGQINEGKIKPFAEILQDQEEQQTSEAIARPPHTLAVQADKETKKKINIIEPIIEESPSKHSLKEDLTLATKGYIKTIASASETVFGENYFLDLTRARFDLELRYKKHIVFRAVYDQEALLGDYLRTQEFKQVSDVEEKDFLDLDWTLLDCKNIFWRHSFYRAYWQYKSERSSLTAGRQRIAWGTGRLWNPTDLFNPIDPLQLEQDEKRGVDAVSFDWFLGDFSFLNFVYAPQTSREDLKAGIRLKTSLEDWDLSFMGGRFEEDEVIGCDFSTTLFEGGIRGEMTYTHTSSDNNDFFRFVLSYDYTFENSLYFLLEYFYNGGNIDLFNLTSFLQDGIVTVQKNFFGLNLGYDITPLIRAETLFISDIDGKSIFIWPKLIWSIAQNLDATAGCQIYHGNEDSEFGTFSNLYYAQLQYFF